MTNPESDQNGSDEVVEGEVVEATEPSTTNLGFELPEDPEQAIELLGGKLSDSRREAASLLDDLKRVAADFDNFRKRTERDRAQVQARAGERILVSLLPILDSLDAALSNTDDPSFAQGLLSIRDQLLGALSREGLEAIDADPGTRFDPGVHEAVVSPEGNGTLVVAEELRRGYRIAGQTVRASLVALTFAGSGGNDDGEVG